MASDPRQLRPTELCRLLNSTPLGEVINERQLHRHRTRAGLRIGDARHVDLLRYVAWLVHERHAPRPEPEGDPYERLKERARSRNIALAIAGRDIGELPEVVNPNRNAKAASDFRFFCEAYFPLTFHLPWSRRWRRLHNHATGPKAESLAGQSVELDSLRRTAGNQRRKGRVVAQFAGAQEKSGCHACRRGYHSCIKTAPAGAMLSGSTDEGYLRNQAMPHKSRTEYGERDPIATGDEEEMVAYLMGVENDDGLSTEIRKIARILRVTIGKLD